MKKNKSKKEIVSDIQLVTDANRRRALVKDVVFPYLKDMNESIAYSKIFLQSFSSIVDGVFDAQRKTTTIQQIRTGLVSKLDEIFPDKKDEAQKREYERYLNFVTKLENISVQDLSYATELSRFIDGFIIKNRDKESIETIPIEEILGK